MNVKQARPSPTNYRQTAKIRNDGTMSQEPYQRVMQSTFEKVLRSKCLGDPNIAMVFGTFVGLREHNDEVTSTVAIAGTGMNTVVHSKYLVGCDGSKSPVRKAVGIEIQDEQLPAKFFMVHFRSRDLKRMHCHGAFWHVFFTNGGILISQDEKDTWTVHQPFPLDANPADVDPAEVVFTTLGGSVGPYTVHIDEILVSGFWRPSTSTADAYGSPQGRVYLAGDSVHQCIPTGGYGMNTGVGDGWDISWKLAAVLHGFGGEQLLPSYEIERRPVGLCNAARSLELMQVHLTYLEWVRSAADGSYLCANSEESRLLHEKIVRHVKDNNTEISEEGIELDYRHPDSPVVLWEVNLTKQEPSWDLLRYTPSTLPGHRAPFLMLSDGVTSIFDLYGPWYSIVDFGADGDTAKAFSRTSNQLNIPLKAIYLPLESHLERTWDCRAVLIRPDGFVAWRLSLTAGSVDKLVARAALSVAVGLV